MKMIKMMMLALAAMFVGAGCWITDTIPPAEADPADLAQFDGASNRVAVCVGLTFVDPNANGGWDGACPGCDVDAQSIFKLCMDNGFSVKMLLNSQATWTRVRSTIIEAGRKLKPGDLLLVSMSGHGGQASDDNGDEADGMDETICLWDGQVRDDEVLKMLNELPSGIRLVLINDQCHSEGNFRSVVRFAQRVVSLGQWGRKVAKPMIDYARGWDGQLIQFAGCREADYSYGATEGGTWTQSLIPEFKAELTWRQWFDAAKAKMPENQVPVWVEFGDVQDSFRNGQVLK